MAYNFKQTAGRGLRPLQRVPALVAAIVLPLAACNTDRILNVDDPDVVLPTSIQNAEGLPSVRAAAIGDFAVAFSGTSVTEGQVLTSGLLADEWLASGTFPTRVEVDRRDITVENGTMQGVFRNLMRARTTAERGAELFTQFGANTAGHAEVLNLAGFTFVLTGENYCSGVPFSTANPDGSFTFGAPESTTQIFQRALARFDAALAAATTANNADQINLARVGRGRALLNLGRFADAATAVRDVPNGFVYNITHSENSGRQNNGVFVFNTIVKRWSISNREGGNGLPFREDQARVPNTRTAFGFDRATPHFTLLKYPNRSAPIPLASGLEARLIEAEAALRANNAATFLTGINAARAAFAGSSLTALTAADVTAAGGDVNLLFRERAFLMYSTSHRLGDLRRLIRQYGRNSEAVFPTGAFFKGGNYGEDVNFPVPVDEENNESFDRSQCDTRRA